MEHFRKQKRLSNNMVSRVRAQDFRKLHMKTAKTTADGQLARKFCNSPNHQVMGVCF